MVDINVNKLSEALNTKADIDLNNTGVFSTVGGGGVNLTSSTSADASGKEVTSADFVSGQITETKNLILPKQTIVTLPFPSTEFIDVSDLFYLEKGKGVTYTAPTNGYLWLTARSLAAGNYIGCYGDAVYTGCEVWAYKEGVVLCCPLLPMVKGQTIKDIRSNFVPTEKFCRFIKALGDV